MPSQVVKGYEVEPYAVRAVDKPEDRIQCDTYEQAENLAWRLNKQRDFEWYVRDRGVHQADRPRYHAVVA